MTLELAAGHRLLRVTTLTPTHCGGSFGSAAVDRPVALDVWHDLPYLPSSALKGVVAGRLGNVRRDGNLNQRRAELFGAPDDDETGGWKASQVVFGDGEPLAFPVVLGEGGRALVVVAATVYRLVTLGLLEAPSLRRVTAGTAFQFLRGEGMLPSVPTPLTPDRFGIDPNQVAALVGETQEAQTVVAAAPAAAAALWQQAVEVRTLTAVGEDRRVRSGSLRSVELIPSGTVFVSLLSNISGETLPLDVYGPLQLGAWESTGLGYVSVEPIGPTDPTQDHIGVADTSPASRASPPHQVMARVYRAMEALRVRPEAPRVRSAILDLGPRLKIRGLPATLAFYLAKAGGETSERDPTQSSDDQRAFGWLLDQLIPPEGDFSDEPRARRVIPTITGERDLPQDFELTRLWLRRYAETILSKGVSNA